MKIRALAVLAALALAACGGGGGIKPDAMMEQPTPIVAWLLLPVGHGLSGGTITVQPGATVQRGNVEIACPSGGPACVLTATRRHPSGASFRSQSIEQIGYDSMGGTPLILGGELAPGSATFDGQRLRYIATRLPFPPTGELQFVGVDLGSGALRQLPEIGQRGNVKVRYGSVRDGSSRTDLAAFLSQASDGAVKRFASPPNLEVIGPATARERALVTDAVEALNVSLPLGSKIRLRSPRPDASLRHIVDRDGRIYRTGAESHSTIQIEFLDCADYQGCSDSGATAWTAWDGQLQHTHSYVQMARGTPAYERDDWARILIAHELLHAMGFDAHVDQRFTSINISSNAIYQSELASILYPIDREALQTLYRRLEPGDDPTSFGPWSSTSIHLAGNGQHANFGVTLRNGYAEPWAHGYRPNTDLASNRSLSGSATWTGTILGLTPQAAAVAGDAEIGVNLGTLAGRADFTNLEAWVAHAAPGAAGTGTQWLDGDLDYTIAVRGNTFRETGGDDGRLTGIFIGRSHEGAAGTLERSDLTAAFGTTR